MTDMGTVLPELGAIVSRPAVAILVTGVAYYAGARVGLLPALVRGQVTPFWPPTGIAVVCLLAFGWRAFPGVALASFAVNAPLGPTLAAAAGIAAGNTLAPLAAVFALRALKVGVELARIRDALLFVSIAVGSMLISATCGTAMLRLSGGVSTGQVWPTWWVWWAGDAMGVLVVAPALLQLRRIRNWRPLAAGRVTEGAVLLAAVGAVMGYAIDEASPAAMVVAPLLVWAAVRFRQTGAALVALEVSVIASAAAAAKHGAFGAGGLEHSMLVLQLFNASVALSGLLFAAVISQLDDSRRDLALANLLLSQRVEERGLALDRDRSRLAVLTDRHRIATQMQDTVLQRLFGVGAALSGAAVTGSTESQQTLGRLVDELDATVNELAVAIYQVDDEAPDTTFRDAIEHVVEASARPAGVSAGLVLRGEDDHAPLALRTQVLAALHEVLTDLTAGGDVRSLDVVVSIDADRIDIAITAEHRRARPAAARVGIARAEARARRLGGTSHWETAGRSSAVELCFPTAPA